MSSRRTVLELLICLLLMFAPWLWGDQASKWLFANQDGAVQWLCGAFVVFGACGLLAGVVDRFFSALLLVVACIWSALHVGAFFEVAWWIMVAIPNLVIGLISILVGNWLKCSLRKRLEEPALDES